MRGAEQRIERELELAMFTAWQTARLSTFHGGKLKKLSDELKALRPAQPTRKQTPEEVVAALRAIRATIGS